MAATQQVYAAPFDAVAECYDEAFTLSGIGRAQRRAVRNELAGTFQAGDRALEIGCGTGVDACFLAERGVRVVATDSSSQMVAVTARRVQQEGLGKLVHPIVLRAENLSSVGANPLFDGVFSNFGALNCVDDLPAFADSLARLLKPGASALLCWMGPYCAWEMLWYLAEGNTKKAFRRLKSGGVTARIAEAAFVRVRYPSVKELKRAFAPDFRLKSVKGIGVAVPPSYVEPWARRHPHLLQMCERADIAFSRIPGLRMLADHVLVRLERRQTGLEKESQE
jgi:ubiquinone/menaquinone biosynthesis C-methylase UbiE